MQILASQIASRFQRNSNCARGLHTPHSVAACHIGWQLCISTHETVFAKYGIVVKSCPKVVDFFRHATQFHGNLLTLYKIQRQILRDTGIKLVDVGFCTIHLHAEVSPWRLGHESAQHTWAEGCASGDRPRLNNIISRHICCGSEVKKCGTKRVGVYDRSKLDAVDWRWAKHCGRGFYTHIPILGCYGVALARTPGHLVGTIHERWKHIVVGSTCEDYCGVTIAHGHLSPAYEAVGDGLLMLRRCHRGGDRPAGVPRCAHHAPSSPCQQ